MIILDTILLGMIFLGIGQYKKEDAITAANLTTDSQIVGTIISLNVIIVLNTVIRANYVVLYIETREKAKMIVPKSLVLIKDVIL